MASRPINRAVRQRKLSTKVNLHIYREGEIELLPIEADDTRPKLETGVEKAEETEHHLQQIITQVNAAATHLYIPTRGTAETDKYDQYYAQHFAQPATYIRFSSTVEDTTGTPYCMSSDDEGFLKVYNAKKSKNSQCSEDQFEDVMSFFEETASTKQPFAGVGDSEPLSYDELEKSYDDTLNDIPRKFAKDVYEHWRLQRIKRDNIPLMPTLRFERNVDSDDADPYVCFRRREIRQARKTRGRDAQVTEKLKRLRVELEQSRQLLHFVKQRELGRRDQLVTDRSIFEHRAKFKEIKRHLGNKEGDEDLINQKPSPKPKPNFPPLRGLPPGAPFPGQRPMRTDSLAIRASDADYPQLEEIRGKQAENIKSFISDNMLKHTSWNKGWTDATWRPITPPLDSPDDESDMDPLGTELRGWKHIHPAVTVGDAAQGFASLPTPPASIASPVADDDASQAVKDDKDKIGPPSRNTRSRNPSVTDKPLTVSFASSTDGPVTPEPVRPLFRTRVGRGGRQMVDRRAPKRTAFQAFPEPSPQNLLHPALALHPYNLRQQSKYADDASDSGIDMTDPFSSTMSELRRLDRFAYDNDDDDEEDEDHRQRLYYTDPYENMNVRYRMMWSRSSDEQRQAQQAQLAAMQRARLSMSGQGGTGQLQAQSQPGKPGG